MNLDELLERADEIHFAKIRHEDTVFVYAIGFSLNRDEHRVVVGSGSDAVDAIGALTREMLERWT
jgi:hypothetical protein